MTFFNGILPSLFLRYVSGYRSLHLVHVPDFTRALMADHTRSYGFPGITDLPEEPAVRGLGKTPQYFIAHAG